MNNTMNWISIGAVLIIVFCVVWTEINKKKNPNRYKNTQGNSIKILFGDLINRKAMGEKQAKGHIQSFTDAREEARRLRYNERQRQLHEDKPIGGMDTYQSKLHKEGS